jgi:hypothetical protein
MEDQEVDLTGVHPVRRAETLRRIAVVKSFVALGRSTRADADHHAGLLGIGYNQFFLLVRAWLEHGRASALPGAKKRLRLVHEHQLRRLDPAIERIISDVIEEKGAFARLTRVLATVRERCEKEGLAPPTNKAVRPRLEEARRTATVTNSNEGTIVIGPALTDVPMLVREGLMEPALLVVSIHVESRRVLAWEVGSPSNPPLAGGVLVRTLRSASVAAPRDLRISLPPDFERERLMVAVRAAGLAGVTWLSGAAPPRDNPSGLLGARLDDVRVREPTTRGSWKLTHALKARTSSVLPAGDVAAAIAAAVDRHNASLAEATTGQAGISPAETAVIERLQRALDATSTAS